MRVGDKVRIFMQYQKSEAIGIISEIYPNEMCKVKISLKYGGYKTIFGYLKHCKLVEMEE